MFALTATLLHEASFQIINIYSFSGQKVFVTLDSQ